MTSQTEKQIITIHILSNISIRKGSQTMISAHLTEFNMRKFFLEKSYTKSGEEASPRPFYIKKKSYKLVTFCRFIL